MPATTELPPFLTKAEVARRYQRSVRSVERDIVAGRYKTIQVGGRVLIPRSEVLLFEHKLAAASLDQFRTLGDEPTDCALNGEACI